MDDLNSVHLHFRFSVLFLISSRIFLPSFATQNILASILAAIVILSTRIVKVGEEITVGQTTGTVSEINLTHTILSVQDDVVFIPNSLIISGTLIRTIFFLSRNKL